MEPTNLPKTMTTESMERTNPTRERLVASATRLIHHRGYAQVAVEDCCLDAGVDAESFGEFFPSKVALVTEALDQQWVLARQYIMEPAFAADVPPLARIERFFRMSYEANRAATLENGCFLGCPFGNRVAELGASEPALRERVREIFDGWAGYFGGALVAAVAAGESPPHDTALAARALLAYFQGVMLLGIANNSAEDIAALTAPALRIIGLPFEQPRRDG